MGARQRVTLTRPVGSADGVIVGMSPADFDRTQRSGSWVSILLCLLFRPLSRLGFGIYIRTFLLLLKPHYARDMEPGPSNPSTTGETDHRNVSAPPKMRLHGGNIPTIPQDKLCPHCPAKFTRWATFEPLLQCYRWLG